MAGDNCTRGYGCMQVWVYVLVPFINAIVGYITNVLALYMTFEPLEMWPIKIWALEGQPIGLFGWQGIVPAKAGQMAAIMTDLMTQKLVDVREIFSRVDPEIMARLLRPGTEVTIRHVVESVLRSEAPAAFAALPDVVKEELGKELARDAPRFVAGFMEKLKDRVLDVYDLKSMCVRLAEADKRAVNNMFQSCGKREFTFIRRSGLYFGFLFGLAQLAIFVFYDPWWLAVIGGFIVGIATNYIALKMIFQPVEPIHIGGWSCASTKRKKTKQHAYEHADGDVEKRGVNGAVDGNGTATHVMGMRVDVTGEDALEEAEKQQQEEEEEEEADYDCCFFGLRYTLHGLFLKRQYEVSKTYSELVAKVFMTPENIWQEIVHGNKMDKFRELLVGHTEAFIDESLGPAMLLLPAEMLTRVKRAVSKVMVEDFEKVLPLGYEYTKEALDIESTIFDALVHLPSGDFERVLHPCFEEDELKLVIVGGALGALAGLFQGLVLFNL